MAALRPQFGSIVKKNGAWHWRYYEDGKQKSVKLADCNDEFRSKKDVVPLANDRAALLAPLSGADQPRSGNITVVDFVEKTYLPWVRETKRPATANGYEKIWNAHLKAHFGNRKLAEYRTHHAHDLLSKLVKGMGRNSLHHVRSVMSGIFKLAKNKGRVAVNPIHDAAPDREPKAPKKTQHYTDLEMLAVLQALRCEPKAQAIMSVAFLGLRTAEIAGLRWEDIDADAGVIRVQRSHWRGTTNPCKTPDSRREVTLGPNMARILEDYKKSRTAIVSGFVFENTAGNPQDMGTYSHRVIRPILKEHNLSWKNGYFAGRRGAETEMNRHTNGNAQITAPHFGHSQEIARAKYIKPVPKEQREAGLALDRVFEMLGTEVVQ